MSDIVERMREWSECNVFPEQAQYVISEAVCEITRLRAEVEDLGNRLHHVHRLWANNEHALRAEVERLRAALERSRTVLGNMAMEYEGVVVNRWPINHEPLRADAKNLLPVIDAALEEKL